VRKYRVVADIDAHVIWGRQSGNGNFQVGCVPKSDDLIQSEKSNFSCNM